MLRPRIQAPIPAKPCSAIPLSTPVSPSLEAVLLRHTCVWKNHSINSGPLTPSGFWRTLVRSSTVTMMEIAKLFDTEFRHYIPRCFGQWQGPAVSHLTVKLRGRAPAPDWSHGCKLSFCSRGDTNELSRTAPAIVRRRLGALLVLRN